MIRILASIAAFLAAASPNATASSTSDIWRRKPAGLVAGWDFSGGRTTSPTGHSGSLVGNAIIAAGTRHLSLDGSGDYFTIGDVPELTIPSGFSISVWVNGDTMVNNRIAGKARISTSTSEWVISTNADGRYFFSVYSGGTTANALTVRSAVRSDASTWTHLLCVYSGGSTVSSLKLYRNGVEDVAETAASGIWSAIANTTSPVDVGARFIDEPGLIGYFDGSLAQFRIYNAILSASHGMQMTNEGFARIANGGTP